MNSKLLISLGMVSLLALTACGKKEEEKKAPAATEQPAATPAKPAAPATPSTTQAPATPAAPAAPMNAADTLKKLKEQAATMTAEQKQAAVATARKAAEDAAAR